MNEQMELLNKKIDLLNEKMDLLLSFHKEKQIVNKPMVWSVEYYKENLLIKFTFNNEFKDFVKQKGGDWLFAKKGWLFSKNNFELIDLICENFPNWTFTDLRKN